jgi:Cu(I)/Ag(I) efflux system periplasmic protein CusF
MHARVIIRIMAAALITAPVFAQTASDHASHHADSAGKPAAATDGEVRKVDKGAGKLTIRHGEIRNLEMPAMTMVFTVKDPAMLQRLKEGDKIKFTADKVNGVYTVTTVEVVK